MSRIHRHNKSSRWKDLSTTPLGRAYVIRQRTPPPAAVSIIPISTKEVLKLERIENDTMEIEVDELDLDPLPSRRVRKHVLEDSSIKNVWKDNLYEEMVNIRRVVATSYKYIAVDTEFPGIIYKPMGTFKDRYEYVYETIRINVNLLKLIQLGLSFTDKDGNKPPDIISAWQFNFEFDFDVDTCSAKSIELLEKAGLDFEKHKTEGIKPADFAELFVTSGCVLSQGVTWLSFHSGYDFGYLLKALLGRELPTQQEFFEMLRIYFPSIFDVKNIIQKCGIYHAGVGLQKLATELHVERVGMEHQAGSDSWVTGSTFFKLQTTAFGGNIDGDLYNGIFGFERDISRRLPDSIACDFRSKVKLSFESGFAVTRTRTAPGSSLVHPEQCSHTQSTSELDYARKQNVRKLN